MSLNIAKIESHFNILSVLSGAIASLLLFRCDKIASSICCRCDVVCGVWCCVEFFFRGFSKRGPKRQFEIQRIKVYIQVLVKGLVPGVIEICVYNEREKRRFHIFK